MATKSATKRTESIPTPATRPATRPRMPPAPAPTPPAEPMSHQLGRRPDLDPLVERWIEATRAKAELAQSITEANRATRAEADARKALGQAVTLLADGEPARFEAGGAQWLFQPTAKTGGTDWERVWAWIEEHAPPDFRRLIERTDPRSVFTTATTKIEFVRI